MAARRRTTFASSSSSTWVVPKPQGFQWQTQGLAVDILDEETKQLCRTSFMYERLPKQLVKGDVLQLREDLELEVKRIVIQPSCEWTLAECEFLRLPIVKGTADTIDWAMVRRSLGAART